MSRFPLLQPDDNTCGHAAILLYLFFLQPNPGLKILPAARHAVASSLLNKRQALGWPDKLPADHHSQDVI